MCAHLDPLRTPGTTLQSDIFSADKRFSLAAAPHCRGAPCSRAVRPIRQSFFLFSSLCRDWCHRLEQERWPQRVRKEMEGVGREENREEGPMPGKGCKRAK